MLFNRYHEFNEQYGFVVDRRLYALTKYANEKMCTVTHTVTNDCKEYVLAIRRTKYRIETHRHNQQAQQNVREAVERGWV